MWNNKDVITPFEQVFETQAAAAQIDLSMTSQCLFSRDFDVAMGLRRAQPSKMTPRTAGGANEPRACVERLSTAKKTQPWR